MSNSNSNSNNNENKNKKSGNPGKSAIFELIVDQQAKQQNSDNQYISSFVPISPQADQKDEQDHEYKQKPRDFLQDVIDDKTDELLYEHGFGYQRYGERADQQVIPNLEKRVGPIAEIRTDDGEMILAKQSDIKEMIEGLDVSKIQIIEKIGAKTIRKDYVQHDGPDSTKLELEQTLKKIHEVYKWLIDFFARHPSYEPEFVKFLDELSKKKMDIKSEVN